MARLIVERLIHSIFVILGAMLIVFGLLHFTSGNSARSLLPEWATEEQIAEF
jgi:ABC-type dipeptide/oligopeptide/nickel transport system permease component